MKRLYYCACAVLMCLLCGCSCLPEASEGQIVYDATQHGVLTENSGEENSKNLQQLIDLVSESGGTVYIPAGEYLFSEIGSQTIGSHCIRMRSNVDITGDGESTVLKPVGESAYGLDMFYFNDYLDTGEAVYLENCSFQDFVIDAAGTSCEVYTSAGKGFMFNLFHNCHWDNVTVKNTDATGFGVDCPIDSSITNCVAINCGKAATGEQSGASGFGIGFGYSEEENIRISGCKAYNNKKFGFFLEHQGRFNSQKYATVPVKCFSVENCAASGNRYNFGGICSDSVIYNECNSENAEIYGFYFEDSQNSKALNCSSEKDREAAFAVVQSEAGVNNITFSDCYGSDSGCGVIIAASCGEKPMHDIVIENCLFSDMTQYAVHASGGLYGLLLTNNRSDTGRILIDDQIQDITNSGNSWNETP